MSGFRIIKAEKLKRYVKPMLEWEGGGGIRCIGLLHSDRGDQYEPAPPDAWELVDDYEIVTDPQPAGGLGASSSLSMKVTGSLSPDGPFEEFDSPKQEMVVRVTAKGWEARIEPGEWEPMTEHLISAACEILRIRREIEFRVLANPPGFEFKIRDETLNRWGGRHGGRGA